MSMGKSDKAKVLLASLDITTREMASEEGEEVSLNLRSVNLVLPKEEQEKREIEEDLKQMGYEGFLGRPWNLKEEEMVIKLLDDQSNEWKGTVQALLGEWSPDMWRKTYRFDHGGDGLASRTDKYHAGKFWRPATTKDKFPVAECSDSREWRVLQFLAAILSPERSSRITVILANTIFVALSGDRKIDWGRVMRDQMIKMVNGILNLLSSHHSCFIRGCHSSLGKLNFPGKSKLVRFLRSQGKLPACGGAVTPFFG